LCSDQERPKKRKSAKSVSNGRRGTRIPAAELRDSIAVGLEAVSVEIAKANKKAKKPNKKADKATKKEVKPSKSKKGKEAKKREKRQKGPQMTNIASLYFGNVIAAANANRNALQQPGFSSKNKATALSELIASIPEEDRKTANADKNALLEATFVSLL
jgi:hypothetical protein